MVSPRYHRRVIKQSAGQAGTGAEAAAPCKICSITPPSNGEKGWEGKEGGGGFLGIGGSILHQLTQVKATIDVGGTSRAGVAVARRGQAIQAGLCVTPSSSGGHACLGATEKATTAVSHVPVRHPLPVPAKSAGSGMTLFFFLDAEPQHPKPN